MAAIATSRSATSKPRGFTLMEVLIALALVSIGLFGLVAAQAYSVRSEFKTGLRFEAGVLASSVLEQSRQTLAGHFKNDVTRQDVVDGDFVYSVEQQFSTEADFSEQLQRVTVRVRWSDDQGEQEYQLWTDFVRP